MSASYCKPDESLPDGRITPASRLLKRERELWTAYVQSHPPQWFTAGDVSALTMLVKNEAAAERLRVKVRHIPTVTKTRSGIPAEHPEHRRLRHLEEHVLRQKKAMRLVSQTSKRIDEVLKLEREASKPKPPWLWRPGPGPDGRYISDEEHAAEQASYRLKTQKH